MLSVKNDTLRERIEVSGTFRKRVDVIFYGYGRLDVIELAFGLSSLNLTICHHTRNNIFGSWPSI